MVTVKKFTLRGFEFWHQNSFKYSPGNGFIEIDMKNEYHVIDTCETTDYELTERLTHLGFKHRQLKRK